MRCSSATWRTGSVAAAILRPRGQRSHSRKTVTVHDIQARLKALGYPMDKTDGKIGSNTRKQIGLYQKANGLKIDCWPSDALLEHAGRRALGGK